MTDTFETLALTNYGHFTTMRAEDGRVRGLTLHLARLVRDCAALFGVTLNPDDVRAEIRAALAGPEPVTVRVTVSDPAFSPAYPARPATPRIVVTTRPATAEQQPPLRVRSTRYARDVPAVKHTGLFGPLHERRRAQLDGYDDALFVGADGLISEGVTWNVGFVDGESVLWPAADVLPGVTTALLAAVHRGPVRTEPVRLDRLARMTAAFATNAVGGVRAIA
jgi:branched-subunit amino acid aminotransferase/4-amino-4-deoxychorismate lyase